MSQTSVVSAEEKEKERRPTRCELLADPHLSEWTRTFCVSLSLLRSAWSWQQLGEELAAFVEGLSYSSMAMPSEPGVVQAVQAVLPMLPTGGIDRTLVSKLDVVGWLKWDLQKVQERAGQDAPEVNGVNSLTLATDVELAVSLSRSLKRLMEIQEGKEPEKEVA